MLRMLEVRRFRSVVESLIENLLRFGSSVRCPLVCGSNVYMPKIIVVLVSRKSKISVPVLHTRIGPSPLSDLRKPTSYSKIFTEH